MRCTNIEAATTPHVRRDPHVRSRGKMPRAVRHVTIGTSVEGATCATPWRIRSPIGEREGARGAMTGLMTSRSRPHVLAPMTFHVVRRQHLWWIDDPRRQVGGTFVDLASALRFIRRHASAARIVVRMLPLGS